MGSFFFSFGKRNCGFDVYIYLFLKKIFGKKIMFSFFFWFFWGKLDHAFDGCFFWGNKAMVLKFKTKIT